MKKLFSFLFISFLALLPLSPAPASADLDSFIISGESDGDWPEKAICHFVAVADALPVGMGHKAVERSKATNAHHDQVTGFPRGHANLGE